MAFSFLFLLLLFLSLSLFLSSKIYRAQNAAHIHRLYDGSIIAADITIHSEQFRVIDE